MTDLWRFLAGLGVFLYAIDLLEQVLKKLAGRSFKLFLRKYTRNLFKSIAGGAIVTAVLQSSSVVSLLVLAFVESGIITFKNALGVILGANVGTTLSGWLVATVGFKLDIESYSLPVVAVAAILMFFFRGREKAYNTAGLFFSLGLLFLGLGFMKTGAERLVSDIDLSSYEQYNAIVFVLIGFIITSLIQSSSATVAITLTAIYTGVIGLTGAAAVVIGSELGTSIKTVLGGLGGSADKKRVATGNFLFNLATCVMAYLLLPWLILFIRQVLHIGDPLIALVAFQTTINIMAILLFLPVIHWFAGWLGSLFRQSERSDDSFITPNLPVVPELAIDALRKEAENLVQKTTDFLKYVLNIKSHIPHEGLLSGLKTFAAGEEHLEVRYSRLKQTEGDILEYYANLQSAELLPDQHALLNQYITAVRHNIHAAKSLKDIHHDLEEFEATASDILYEHYALLQKEWLAFDSAFLNILSVDGKVSIFDQLTTVMKEAFSYYNRQNTLMIGQLRDKKLSEMQISTLMNVQREILSAKKSLLRAAAYLRLTPEQAREFEFLP